MARRQNITQKKVQIDPNIRKSPEWIKDHREVTGVFRNFEVNGGGLKFYYRKWKGDNIEMYEFEDGVEYTVPYMVAQHLNNNCAHLEHEHAVDERGRRIERIAKKKHRFGFYSNRFFKDTDDDLIPTPDLYVPVQSV